MKGNKALYLILMLTTISLYAEEEYKKPVQVRSTWSLRWQPAQMMFRDALAWVNIHDYWSLSDAQAIFLAVFRNAVALSMNDKAIMLALKREGFYRNPRIMNNVAIMGAAAYMYYRGEPTAEQVAEFKSKFFPRRWWQQIMKRG